jgi:transcriptional regulator with XRE-family HTH domain
MKTQRTPLEDTSVNERIVTLRHTLNITQAEFAQKILISNGFIAQLELGVRKVNDRLIKLINTTFGVNEGWLQTGEGEIFRKDMTPDYNMDEVEEIFKKLNPFFQDFILDQLRKLLEYETKNGGKGRNASEQGNRSRWKSERAK